MTKYDWFKDAERVFRSYSKQKKTITGEEFRGWCERSNLLADANPHWWGNLINNAKRHGWIVDSGETQHMSLPRSHGRRTPIWTVV